MPLDWSVQRDHTTRSLLVDKNLLHEYVPHDSPLIGPPLRFDYGVERILSEIMDAAWHVTTAGGEGPSLGGLSVKGDKDCQWQAWDYYLAPQHYSAGIRGARP